jgi:hypothetical protein
MMLGFLNPIDVVRLGFRALRFAAASLKESLDKFFANEG